MQKYNSIIGKRIKLVLDGSTIAAYKITFMHPKPIMIPQIGLCYKCATEWEPSPNLAKINDSPSTMEFPEADLEDLCTKGSAQSPILDNMQFVVDKN